MEQIAARVIEKMGGPKKVADAVSIDVSNVHRWTYPKERGGTGGIIPTKHLPVLLAHALSEGIDLKPDDFFNAPADGEGEAA